MVIELLPLNFLHLKEDQGLEVIIGETIFKTEEINGIIGKDLIKETEVLVQIKDILWVLMVKEVGDGVLVESLDQCLVLCKP